MFVSSVKLLDWGEEGQRTEGEIASLRAAFTQEVSVWHKLDHPNVSKVGAIYSCTFVFSFFLLFGYLIAQEFSSQQDFTS